MGFRRLKGKQIKHQSQPTCGNGDYELASDNSIQDAMYAPANPQKILQLQRLIGNRATLRLVDQGHRQGYLQRKREDIPDDLETSYANDVVHIVMDVLTEIADNDNLSGLVKRTQMWLNLNQNFNIYRDNGVRYWGILQDAIGRYQEDEDGFSHANEATRQGYDDKYRNHYQSRIDDEDIFTKGFADNNPNRPIEDPEVMVDGEVPYSNGINRDEQGRFFMNADSNYGREGDDARNAAEGGAGPGRLPNSEIFWQQVKAYLQQADLGDDQTVEGALSEMPKLKRHSISNEETMAVIYMCHPNGVALNTVQTWQPGSEEFNAILGTDNGKAGVFMLKDHLDQMNKTITHIASSIQEMGGEIEIHFGPI